MHPNYNLVITQTITLHERERKKEIEGREREGEGREIEISFLLSSNSSMYKFYHLSNIKYLLICHIWAFFFALRHYLLNLQQ